MHTSTAIRTCHNREKRHTRSNTVPCNFIYILRSKTTKTCRKWVETPTHRSSQPIRDFSLLEQCLYNVWTWLCKRHTTEQWVCNDWKWIWNIKSSLCHRFCLNSSIMQHRDKHFKIWSRPFTFDRFFDFKFTKIYEIKQSLKHGVLNYKTS